MAQEYGCSPKMATGSGTTAWWSGGQPLSFEFRAVSKPAWNRSSCQAQPGRSSIAQIHPRRRLAVRRLRSRFRRPRRPGRNPARRNSERVQHFNGINKASHLHQPQGPVHRQPGESLIQSDSRPYDRPCRASFAYCRLPWFTTTTSMPGGSFWNRFSRRRRPPLCDWASDDWWPDQRQAWRFRRARRKPESRRRRGGRE